MALSPIEIHLCDQSSCTGCMACRQICKAGAITTKKIDGFSYPDINRDLCKACGLCMKVCPILNQKGQKGNCHENTQTCLAAWNKSTDVRMKSSSGGVFSALAEQVFLQGGVVFGAAWDSKMVLRHKSVECPEDLESIRRSKYVQSDVGETFRQVELFLKEERTVLYCGTPCQIAGLRSFLIKDYDNLLLVDFLCQGVPSQNLLSKYIQEIEKKYKARVVDANFRTKEKGWRSGLCMLLLSLENGKKIKCALNRNEYYNAFIQEYFMRRSCYDCKFKKNKLGYFSDITIADFWRIGNKVPLSKEIENDYAKGISAIVVNTEKGKRAFELCADKIEAIERTWKEFSTNGGLNVCKQPANNGAAYDYLKSHSWHDAQQKFFPLGLKRLVKNFLMLHLGEHVVRKIKKM